MSSGFANEREMPVEDVRAMLRTAVEAAGSQIAWARAHRLSGVYVSDVLHGRREPAGKILAALGMEKIVMYRPKLQRKSTRRST
jgi:hypothetical protein